MWLLATFQLMFRAIEMQKEKKLYITLLLLLVFALSGEQPKLREDLRRTATGVMRLLQVDEISDSGSPSRDLGRGIRNLADRLLR